MNETDVLAALTTATDADGVPLLSAEEIVSIALEGDWLCVSIRKEGAAETPFLARVYRQLRQAFPGAEVELRARRRIYRGGDGFGEGRYLVAVLGGKGGVGKSTLAANLAITLWAMGIPTGLLDADLNAPDIPHLLGIHPAAPLKQSRGQQVEGWGLPMSAVPPAARRKPLGRHNLEIMSVGFFVPESRPMALTGEQLVSGLLRNLVFDVAWTARILLIDAPPGTGDVIQSMARQLPLSGAVFVTTPQDLAQMNAERTLTLLREQGISVIGTVQNMASLTCPHCEQPIDLYAYSTRLEQAGVPILGRVRFDTRLGAMADQGTPLVLADPRGPIAYEFARIGAAVRRWLEERDQQEAAS